MGLQQAHPLLHYICLSSNGSKSSRIPPSTACLHASCLTSHSSATCLLRGVRHATMEHNVVCVRTVVMHWPHLRFSLHSIVAENGPVVQAFGCLPVLNDRDSWPAFVYLISAELSTLGAQHNVSTCLTSGTVVVLLTLLRRYLEPLAFCTWGISFLVPVLLPLLTAFFATADSSSYSSVLLCTMYRDGGWLHSSLKPHSHVLPSNSLQERGSGRSSWVMPSLELNGRHELMG